MSCEGIWRVEVKGPYGWERISTAFMKNGEYLAASANHYAVGSYREDGDNVEITALVTQYGDMRTVFGKKQAHELQITSRCRIENNTITGTSKAKGVKHYDILIRLTRLDSFK
jgi:hypothetical protein